MRLLLISNSTRHGEGYLEHCRAELGRFLDGVAGPVLFVPFALADLDRYAVTARAAFERLGHELTSLHEQPDAAAALAGAGAIFVGGGNTFRLLSRLQDRELLEPIRRRVRGGLPYVGTSAGSNLACPTIRTTNDMPIVQPADFRALDLVPFQLNPHYLDPDPGSTHMGETREQRIREFHEEDDTPVLGLREGGMLLVEDATMRLLGPPPLRLFRRGTAPEEFASGADLSFLLARPAQGSARGT